jgi:CubicO group peptidase (beta-lactamase class C family)
MKQYKYIKFLFFLYFIFTFLFCASEPEESIPKNFEWQVVSPESVNLDSIKINDGISEAGKYNYINSILVIKDGKIVSEKYFNGFSKSSAQIVRSVSKSFLSATYGIAEEKSVLSVDNKIMDYLSKYKSYVIDNRYNNITILNLLQMRGGLDHDRNIYFTAFQSKNWIKTIFELGLKNSPGTKFSYSTLGAHLLSAVLTNASGMSSKDFVEKNLITPMGISLEKWEKDPQGIYFGGNNMYFTSRNMAAFGLMYMNNGKLNGKQIVSNEWVERSLKYSSGGLGDWGELKNIGYGLFWWLGEMNGKKVFTAIGHGGQFIMCVPSINMIIVTTAESYIYWEQADKQETKIMEIMSNYFISAEKTN